MALLRRSAASRDVRSVGVVLAGNLAARALGALYPIALAQYLGKQDFALAILYVNTGFFVGELITTGFPLAMTQKIAASLGKDDLSVWAIPAILGGLPLLAASIVCGAVMASLAGASPILLGLVVLGLTIDAYYFGILRGVRAFGLLTIYRTSANLLQLVLIVGIGISGGASLPAAITIYAFAYVGPLVAIELLRPTLRSAAGWRPAETARRVRELGHLAVPALISGVAYGAIVGLDVYFVRTFAPDALADYGAARTLILPLLMVPFAISVVIVPSVAGAKTSRRWQILRLSLSFSVLVAVGASLGYLGLAGPVIGILFPASYGGAAALTHALAPAFGLVGIHSVIGQWWLGIGRPWPATISLVVAAIVAIGCHAVITAALGGTGAAISIGAGTLSGLAFLGAYTTREWFRSGSVAGPEISSPAEGPLSA